MTGERCLRDFLLARIAEDEARARAAVRVWGDDAWDTMQPETVWLAAHIEPARVLTECEAKRRMVQRHESCGTGVGYCDGGGHGWTPDDPGCADLADLALPYADHPDYRGAICAFRHDGSSTSLEHYMTAQNLLDSAAEEDDGSHRQRYNVAAAQVHATLALVAATTRLGANR